MLSKSIFGYVMVITIGLTTCLAGGLAAVSPAFQFLDAPVSGRTLAMGDCSINEVYYGSSNHNPGAVGLFYHDFAFSLKLPYINNYLPGALNNTRFQGWSVGTRLKPFGTSDKIPPLVFSVAVTRHKINYGLIQRQDEIGNAYGEVDTFERAYLITIAAGYENRYRLGIGYTIKKIDTKFPEVYTPDPQALERSAVAHEVGFLFEFPIHRFLSLKPDPEGSVEWQITPSVAGVLSDFGPDVEYFDVNNKVPLPKTLTGGFALLVKYVKRRLPLFSLRGAHERTHSYYRERVTMKRYGLQLGLLDALFLRVGKFDFYFPAYYPWENDWNHQTTYGLGFQLSGLLNWLDRNNTPSDRHGFSGFLQDRLDLQFDYTNVADKGDASYMGDLWQAALIIR